MREYKKNSLKLINREMESNRGKILKVKKFEERKIPSLKEQLYSHQNWSTDTVMQLFYLWIEREFRVTSTQVSIIDPCFLTLIVDSERVSDHNLQKMKSFMEQSQLLLIPLTYRDHWSLVAYLPGGKRWFSCDSRGRYHEERFRFVRERLDSLGLVGREGETVALFGPLLESQVGLFESGSFTLFYGFVSIHALCEVQGNSVLLCDQNALFDRLCRTLPLVTEIKRLQFLSFTEKLLSSSLSK